MFRGNNVGQAYGAGEYSSPDPVTAANYGKFVILNLVIHPSVFHKNRQNNNEIYIVTPNPADDTHISYMLPIGVAYYDSDDEILIPADSVCPQ
eukprot:UN05035